MMIRKGSFTYTLPASDHFIDESIFKDYYTMEAERIGLLFGSSVAYSPSTMVNVVNASTSSSVGIIFSLKDGYRFVPNEQSAPDLLGRRLAMRFHYYAVRDQREPNEYVLTITHAELVQVKPIEYTFVSETTSFAMGVRGRDDNANYPNFDKVVEAFMDYYDGCFNYQSDDIIPIIHKKHGVVGFMSIHKRSFDIFNIDTEKVNFPFDVCVDLAFGSTGTVDKKALAITSFTIL